MFSQTLDVQGSWIHEQVEMMKPWLQLGVPPRARQPGGRGNAVHWLRH